MNANWPQKTGKSSAKVIQSTGHRLPRLEMVSSGVWSNVVCYKADFVLPMDEASSSETDQQTERNNVSSTMDVSDYAQSEQIRCNPFDDHLLETLHRPTFTPSVFARVVSPTNSIADSPISRPTTSRGRSKRPRKFRWSIDHIAALNPAEIDENELALQDTCQRYDDETEARFQAAIDKFFSQPFIAPSPWKSEDHVARPCEPVVVQSPSPWKRGEHTDNDTPGTDLEHSFSTAKAPPANTDINSSVYLLSNSSDDGESPPFSRKRLHLTDDNPAAKPLRTSMGIDDLSSPELSPIKDASPKSDKEEYVKDGATFS